MILSNTSIQEALDKKWLVIEPEPEPREPTREKECPYQTTAVDLTLGTQITWIKEDLPITIDLRRGSFIDLFGPNSENLTISEEQAFTLKPRCFVLGKTHEKITLPILPEGDAPSLAARVEGRSSYARCGMLVHFTAPTIHAGFKGNITLELINLGSIPISLYPHAPICQLIIEQVVGVPFRNDSQFHEQTRPGGGN